MVLSFQPISSQLMSLISFFHSTSYLGGVILATSWNLERICAMVTVSYLLDEYILVVTN